MFSDTHCHLQDSRLAESLDFDELRSLGISKWVVNGTRESDWEKVANLAAKHPEVTPSFGLHPWYVAQRSPDWLEKLQSALAAHPKAGIGEIGLDRWIKGYDTPTQEAVFRAQLEIAAKENRPASIHCLQAWGRMLELLRNSPRPDCGFLLHSYGGPAEMIEAFVKIGAYFSVSGYFFLPRKAKTREVFRQIPMDRLLIETDAPEQVLPEEMDRFPRTAPESGERINHPGNLIAVYEATAALRKMPVEDLCATVDDNFRRLFGVC